MATEIRFEYDAVSLEKVEKKLGSLKSEARTVLKTAINQTAKDARKSLASKARETYTVKIGGFNSQMKIANATTESLEAIITSHGAPLEMRKFSVRGGKPGPRGPRLQVKIKNSGSYKTLERGFVNNIARKGQMRKKDTAKGAAGSQVTHIAAARRAGKSRLKINSLYSLAVPSMLGSEKDVYGVLEPNILTDLRDNVEKQVKKVLEAV